MSVLAKNFYRASGWLHPASYVETGTYKGKNLEQVVSVGEFKEIHSIELSEQWHKFNQMKFADNPIVHLHNGDSAQVLQTIITKIELPVQFFLDAHYSGPGTALGKLETPLLEELKSIASANLPGNNVIVIDDCRMLGRRGLALGGGDYQAFESDWSDITERHIVEIVGENYIMLHNNLNHWTYGKIDQIILLKLGGMRAFFMILEDRIIGIISHAKPIAKGFRKIASNLTKRTLRD
jgi:hypothetical protein